MNIVGEEYSFYKEKKRALFNASTATSTDYSEWDIEAFYWYHYHQYIRDYSKKRKRKNEKIVDELAIKAVGTKTLLDVITALRKQDVCPSIYRLIVTVRNGISLGFTQLIIEKNVEDYKIAAGKCYELHESHVLKYVLMRVDRCAKDLVKSSMTEDCTDSDFGEGVFESEHVEKVDTSS